MEYCEWGRGWETVRCKETASMERDQAPPEANQFRSSEAGKGQPPAELRGVRPVRLPYAGEPAGASAEEPPRSGKSLFQPVRWMGEQGRGRTNRIAIVPIGGEDLPPSSLQSRIHAGCGRLRPPRMLEEAGVRNARAVTADHATGPPERRFQARLRSYAAWHHAWRLLFGGRCA